jgi:GT2 family glycosyltransferase
MLTADSLSIIIPTYNGVGKILNVLQALEKQTFTDFEVIVVVDGSTDNTLQVLTGYNFSFEHFRVIEQENRGRAGSRNRGATEAEGKLLIFFDDDMRPLPDCVEWHVQHHQKYLQTIAVGDVPEDLVLMQTDFQHYKAHLSRKWTLPLQENEGIMQNPYLTAANFSIPKSLFDQLGGFDERLTDAEDFDLAVRALRKEVPVYFLPQAIGWHDDFITCRSYIRRLRQYQKAHEQLRQLKPEFYPQHQQYQAAPKKGWKKEVYRLFSYDFWVRWVDDTGFLLILPRQFRYQLYDLITTAQAVHFTGASS